MTILNNNELKTLLDFAENLKKNDDPGLTAVIRFMIYVGYPIATIAKLIGKPMDTVKMMIEEHLDRILLHRSTEYVLCTNDGQITSPYFTYKIN